MWKYFMNKCLLFLLFLFWFGSVNAAVLPYTPTAPGMTFSHGALSRINDGNIATNSTNDFQVHPSNAIWRTIFMTFDSLVSIQNAEFFNRTGCCQNRIWDAQMIFKDSSWATIYTYTFAGPYANTWWTGNGNLVTITDPSGNINGVKTVELTNFGGNSQNFREIRFNGSETPAPGWVTSDLKLWLKADTWVYTDTGSTLATDGTAIESWLDQSLSLNHHRQPTLARRPNLISNDMNFNPSLDFNATQLDFLQIDRWLDGTTNDADMGNISGTNPIEVFVVSERDITGNGSTFYAWNNIGTADRLWVFDQASTNQIVIRDNSGNRLSSFVGSILDPHMYNWQTAPTGQIGSTVLEVDASSTTQVSSANPTSVTNVDGNRMMVWARQNSGQDLHHDGQISEVIVYDNLKWTGSQRQQIQSYLGIKYWITLDSSIGSYKNSSGTDVYDLTTYSDNIVGIARDSASGLDQQISKSVNWGSILTLSTDTNFTDANGTHSSLSEGQFILVGSNGLATTTQVVEFPTGTNEWILREWKLENTGWVTSINMKFDGFDDNWILYVDGDNNFNSGARQVGTLNSDGEITVVLGNGGGSEIGDGEFFTLARAGEAPGGVSGWLTMWLDADDASTLFQETSCTNLATDGQGVGCWQDKSWAGNDVRGTGEPTVLASDLNGKTTLRFLNDSLVTAAGGQITSNSGYTKFAVVKYDGTWSNNIISSSPGTHAFWWNGWTQISMWHAGTFINSVNLGTSNYQIGVGRYGAPDALTNVINVDGTQAASNTTTRNFNATSNITRIWSHGTGNALNGRLAEAIVYDRALSDDEIDAVECYLSGKWGIPVTSNCQIDTSELTLTIPENGGTDTFSVQLGEQPTSDVVVNIVSADGSEATVTPATMTFTNGDWNVGQTVTVTAVDDIIIANDTTSIIISVDDSLSDDDFDAAPDVNVSITLSDDDAIGPGWVTSNLTTWLKADAGIVGNPITSWNSSFGISPSVVGTPDLETESINFNPAVSFQWITTNEYFNFGNIVNGWNQAQAFMVTSQERENVVNPNETGHWRIWWNSNSHSTWTNELLYESFGNSNRINAITTPYSTHIPYLYSASQSSSNQANLYWNGENIHSSVRPSFFGNQPVWLARGRWWGRYLGDIPEFAFYNTPLSIPEQQRVNSYFALKYGLTLDQSTPTDYLASDGSTEMWDKDLAGANTYNNNITGIGRDDNSGLGQIKSRSSNPDSLVIIEAEGEWTNAVNTFIDLDDLEFLTWAHDDWDMTVTSFELPAGLPAAATGRMPREWQAQAEGNLWTVSVTFDLWNQLLLDIAGASDYALLLDADGDFSNATVYTTGASLSGDEISFSWVGLTDGMYFTLAGPPKPAPGWVGAAVWLKANEGTDTVLEDAQVTTWSDQAGSNNAIGVWTTRPTFENDLTDQFNFNPTLRFNSSHLTIARNFPETDFTQLVVYKTTDANGNISTMVSPTTVGAGANDRNFRIVGGGLSHRLWNANQTITSTQDFNDDFAHIGSVTVENGVGQTLHSDGNQVGFGTRGFSNFTWQTGMVIGNHRGNALNADIAELIFVDNALDASNRNKMESYLALKYGITLDQTTPNDYRSSNGSLIFDATVAMNAYRNDIAGIGQDDNSDLNQTQSKSQNDDAIVTIANASSQDNNDFLMWGNNSGSLSQVTNNLPAWPVSRLDRTWKVEETNEVGTVDVSIDISSLGITSTAAARLGLIIDDNTDFTSGATVETGDSLVSWVVTFNSVNFSDGDHFTLGIIPVNIGDKIWSDINGDGIQSGALEIGISDITIDLYSDDGTSTGVLDGSDTLVASTTTSANGDYDFTGLDSGDYIVDITDTNGWLSWALQTWWNTAPEFISAPAGADINTADYGYQFTAPPVTDANISVNTWSWTSGTFIVGDTFIVTWDASVTWDIQTHKLRSVIADLSTLGGWANTVMTDTTACGWTAGDNIYEACIIYTAGVIDANNLNPTITASNAGATTGPVADSTNSSVDNKLPVIITSGLIISPDNSVLDVAAVNGNGVAADGILVNATLSDADGDTITWDATSIGGSTTQANNVAVLLGSWSLDDSAVTFDITVSDNAGNSITLNTDEIDNLLLSIDNDVPSGLTFTSHTGATITWINPTLSWACTTGADITISSAGIVWSPLPLTCIAGNYSTPVTFVSWVGMLTIDITQADISGNFGGSISRSFEVDEDWDGNPNSIEDAGNNGGDGNGDGLLDSTQSEVSGVPNALTGDYTTIATSGWCNFITENAAVAEWSLSTSDPSFDYPLGLVDFQVQCSATGASSNVTVYYWQEYDTSAWQWRKYSASWSVYSDISGIVTYGTGSLGGTTVTTASFTVTDGDPLTDEDGVADGVINDPSGPAIPPVVTTSSGGWKNYSCRDENAINYKTYGFSKPELCEYEDEVVAVVSDIDDDNTEEETNTDQEIQESEKETLPEQSVQEDLEKDKDYTVKNDFKGCSSIRAIQDPNYVYKASGIFSDEDSSNYKQAILKFAQIWVINGYNNGDFGPKNTITRAEFLKIALVSHCYSYSKQDPSELEYIDVDKTSWQAKVISKARDLAMIDGDILNIDTDLIDTNLWRGYSQQRITELKRVLKLLWLYSWEINWYYTSDLVNAVYEFQLSEGIVSNQYQTWAWSWWPTTRKAFFDRYGNTDIKIFRPDDVISKAEAVKILMKLSLIEATDPQPLGYNDITVNWHEKYIRTGESLGLFNSSRDNNKFNPDGPVKREDMVDLVNRLVQLYK